MSTGLPEVVWKQSVAQVPRAEIEALGPLVQRWDYRAWHVRIERAIGALVVVSLFLTLAIWSMGASWREWREFVALYVILAGGSGAIAAARTVPGQDLRMELRHHGLWLAAFDREGIVRWDQIRTVHVEPGGREFSGSRTRYLFSGTIVSEVCTLSVDARFKLAVDHAQSRTLPLVWARMISVLDRGATYVLGPVAIGADTLTVAGQTFPWRALASVQIDGRWLRVMPVSRPSVSVAASAIPCSDLVERVAQCQLLEERAYRNEPLPRTVRDATIIDVVGDLPPARIANRDR
jgi:hypothetical protein